MVKLFGKFLGTFTTPAPPTPPIFKSGWEATQYNAKQPINCLPKACLTRILETVVDTEPTNPSEWKVYLPLVQVCKLWSSLIDKYVYRHLFIKQKINKETEKPHLDSNISLIIDRNMTYNVKYMDLVVEKSLYDLVTDFTQLYYEMHGNNLHYWYGITDFRMRIKHTLPTQIDLYPDAVFSTPRDETPVMSVIFKLVRLFRYIYRFDVDLGGFDARTKYFCQMMVTVYYKQLDHINCVLWPFYIPRDLNNKLKHLSFVFYDDDLHRHRYFPVVYARSLEFLRLYGLPRDFSWHRFYHPDQIPFEICFKELKHVELYYMYEGAENGSFDTKAVVRYQMLFPKLEHLHLHLFDSNCDIIYASLFPSLKTLKLYGSLSAIKHMDYSATNQIEYLDLHFTDISQTALYGDEEVSFYEVTNGWLQYITPGAEAKIYIPSIPFTLEPSLLAWDTLTKLCLYSIEFQILEILLPSLFSLRQLIVYNLTFDLPKEHAFHRNVHHGLILDSQILNNSIKYLTVTGDNVVDKWDAKMLIYIITYIVASTPCLTNLHIRNSHVQETIDLLRQNVQKYNHIENINVNTW